jgi:RND family efflux transporter MFP subunit
MQETEDTQKTKKPRKSLKRRLWGLLPSLVVILMVGVIVLLVGRINSESEVIEKKKLSELKTERPKTNVVAMEMVPGLLRERINLPGTVKPWVALEVAAEIRGNVVAKKAAEGQRVKKGDVLAVIDSRDYATAHASAKASNEVAQATQKRMQRMIKENVGTQAQLDEIIANYKTSKAALDSAALNLERCVIRAPISGVVNRIYIEKGQYVKVEQEIAEILNTDRVKVQVGIPESDVDAVRNLEQFEVVIDALGGKVFQGTRHYLYQTTDSFARLYNLEIALDNPDGEILPDMFTRVSIVKKEVPDGLGVPLYALLNKNKMHSLYVVDQDVVQLRPVEVGIQDGWRMQVKKGLAPGDKVVVMGQRSIDHGEVVNVTRTVRTMEELTQ